MGNASRMSAGSCTWALPSTRAARKPPRRGPTTLLQWLDNITPQISQRRPWTLQLLYALDPHLTPTALASQTFCRSRQQRVHSKNRKPQHPRCMNTPALQQR